MGIIHDYQITWEKMMTHMYLKSKLTTLSKTSEDILLIDLEYDYYTGKFLKVEKLYIVLHGGGHGSSMNIFSLSSFDIQILWHHARRKYIQQSG